MANLAVTDDSNLCKNNYYYALASEYVPNPSPNIPPSHTGIADSGASGFYFAPNAPVANYNALAPTVGVRVANGRPEHSVASATLASASSLPQAAMSGHVMPSFPHTLIGLGPFVDHGCTVVFTATDVTVYHPDGHPVLAGWREQNGPRLWHFPLTKQGAKTTAASPITTLLGTFPLPPPRPQSPPQLSQMALANASPQPHIPPTAAAAHVAGNTASHPPPLSIPPPPPRAPSADESRTPRK